mmetsp:Transcript_20101/g.45670  ORF Transcript_20101/g.45670 Transcript_20101/m.45670 type:complete len:402 (-) Transcript_20101:134-1339(-)
MAGSDDAVLPEAQGAGRGGQHDQTEVRDYGATLSPRDTEKSALEAREEVGQVVCGSSSPAGSSTLTATCQADRTIPSFIDAEADRTARVEAELKAQEAADIRSKEKVRLCVSDANGGGRLADVTVPLGNTVREVGQIVMRQAALPIMPRLYFGEKLLQGGDAANDSEMLMDAGIPSGQADLTAELCTGIVTASKDCTAKIWNAETGVCELSLEGHNGTVFSASFAPTCRAVVTASEDRTAKIWRTEDGKCMRTLQGHRDAVYSASYSADGKWVVTASEDGTGKIWIVKTGDCKYTLRGHSGSVLWASYAPDGKHVTTTSRDGTLRIWNAKTGVCDRTLSGQEPVYLVSFTSDGKSFVTQNSGDSSAKICNLTTGECERELHGHKDLVLSASFAPALRGELG